MQGTLNLAKALSDCKVGEEKEITLVVVPSANGEDGFKADVVSVVDYEEEKEEKEPPKDGKMGKRMAPAAEKATRYS